MPISYTLTTPVVDLPHTLPDLAGTAPLALGELFKQLSYGELHDLKAGLDGAGNIRAERRNQVVHLTNEGLRRLHQRFELIRTSEELAVPPGTTPLLVPLPVLVLQVSSITCSGESMSFHTRPVPGEIFVYNGKISFPTGPTEYRVQVTYQKRHPLLRPIQVDADLQQPVYLREELWPALRAHVAGEMYGNMNTQDAMAAAVRYRQRYLEVCAEVEALGGTPQAVLEGRKFDTRGFV